MKLLIHNRLFDITKFHHPGGAVIRTYEWTPDHPIDATNAYNAFHRRTKRAAKMLATLPSEAIQEAAKPRDAVEDAFPELCTALQRNGYFRPSLRHVAYRILMNAAMWYMGRTLVLWGFHVCGIAIMAVTYVQCGWIQHECGHRSFTCVPAIDNLLQIVYLNVFMGGNYRFWNDQHFSHHANTQNAHHDKDLKTHPLVAFNERSLEGKRHTIFTRHQHWLYWGVINPLVWATWSFLSYPIFAYRTGHALEYATTKSLSLLFYSYLIFPSHSFLHGVGWFHIVSLLGSMILLATFTVSHTTTEAYVENKGWVRPSAQHTINIPDHWLTNWWMGFLNFQIEHHLFPTMPQFRQGEVGKLYVRPFFEAHDLPYQETPFWKANMDVFHNLKRVSMAKDADKKY